LYQIIGFAVQPSSGFSWYTPAVSWLQRLANPIGLSQSADGSNSVGITYLALLTVTVLLLNFAYVFYMFSHNQFEQIWALRMLRLVSGSIVCSLFHCFCVLNLAVQD
jgi:hypothetical protein